jgi:DNA (cytosine-5)-methyltransferase 1
VIRFPKAPDQTFAEFFAGIGLMRMGLEAEGWKVAYANDICPDKFDMYRANFEDADDHFDLRDIHRVNAADVPTVLLATASFPCNDLSLAGSRSGLQGSQSSAFYGFARVLKEMGSRRPRFVLLENVGGFLSSNGGKDFHAVMLTLNKLGYSVDPFMIDAVHFVPQSRQRLFVLGEQRDSAQIIEDRVESAEFFESDVRPRALAEFIFNHPNVDWSVRELPKLPQSTKRLTSILENLSDDRSEWWNEKRTSYLLNQMSQRHRTLADKMICACGWSFGTVFRRVRAGRSMAELRVDGIAGCLRTPRGGSGRQILVKAGFGEFHARLLTPTECARLMGADRFKISGSLNQALFGFGDAVCVPVIKWIAKHYLEARLSETGTRSSHAHLRAAYG